MPVDVGVRGLVEALSLFPTLETQESCEGDGERGPWVCFRYGDYWKDDWRSIAEFVLGFLGPELAERVGDSAEVSLRITSSGALLAALSVRPGCATPVETALRELAAQPRP